MRILVVCQYYFPEPFKITEICEELVKRGHNVTVLTGLPNYPDGLIPLKYRFGKLRHETINGVKVLRCFEIPRKNRPLFLALNYMSFMISASFKSLFLKNEFDVIFIYQLSPVLMAIPAMLFKMRSNLPLYLYCCDIWPESMKIYCNNDNNNFYKFIKRLSKWIYSYCDEISVSSPAFVHYFMTEHNLDKNRISFLPQHGDDLYSKMDLSAEENGYVDFMFMGNIGLVQDIECILEATNIAIKDVPNIRVHFVGDGTYRETAISLTQMLKLNEVVFFHGRHPLSKMVDFYKIADVCLLTLKSDNLVGLTIPSKLQGYMSAGKPIIGAINGAAQEIIKISNCGICVNSGDAVELAKAMTTYSKNPQKYKNCGNNAKSYFLKHFTKEKYIDRLERILMNLTGGDISV